MISTIKKRSPYKMTLNIVLVRLRQTQVAVNPTDSGKVSVVSNRYAGNSCMKLQEHCGEQCFECANLPPPQSTPLTTTL